MLKTDRCFVSEYMENRNYDFKGIHSLLFCLYTLATFKEDNI